MWLCRTDRGKRFYFFLAVTLSFIRVLKVPALGNIMPAMPMFGIMLVSEAYKSLAVLRGWYLYLLAIILSCLLGLLTTETSRVFSWICPLWDVMAIASLTPLYIKTQEDLQIFTRCILSISFIYSFFTIIAFWGFYDGVVILAMTDADITNNSRIYGIAYSNLVQALSAITICLLPHTNISQKLKILLIVVIAYAALITLKRMSFIAIILSLLYFIYIEYKNKQYKIIIAVLTIIAIAAGSSFFMFIINRFNIFSDTASSRIIDNSSQTRVDRINYAWDSFIDSPLYGNGAGYAIYIHNGILEVLANCGVMGLLLIIGQYLKPLEFFFRRNPWSMCVLIFFVTCFSLEAALSRSELMCFLGFFIGGYAASKKIQIDYTSNNEQQIECDNSDV